MDKLLLKAIEFAKIKHNGQVRKGKRVPYFTHVEAVAKLLSEEKCDKRTIIVGLLHDTIEDTQTTKEELIYEFGSEIADMVDTLSENKKLPYNERKHLQALRIQKADLEVKLVKCADCLSNLTDTYEDLQTNPNIWSVFNAPRSDIQKHYEEMIVSLQELDGYNIYDRLINVYYKVFEETKAQRYCTDCLHMKRILTPDPYDWFCADDETYVCGKNKRILSEANRPYEKQQIPSDCPLEM